VSQIFPQIFKRGSATPARFGLVPAKNYKRKNRPQSLGIENAAFCCIEQKFHEYFDIPRITPEVLTLSVDLIIFR
jgi:hypothetical protein